MRQKFGFTRGKELKNAGLSEVGGGRDVGGTEGGKEEGKERGGPPAQRNSFVCLLPADGLFLLARYAESWKNRCASSRGCIVSRVGGRPAVMRLEEKG